MHQIFLTKVVLGAFFTSFLLVGFYDQLNHVDDIYPYSDWYLFSFVNAYGEIYDLQYEQTTLMTGLIGVKRQRAAEELFRLSKLVYKKDTIGAAKKIEKLRDQYQLTGPISLIKKEIERLEYYQTKKTRGESLLYTWNP